MVFSHTRCEAAHHNFGIRLLLAGHNENPVNNRGRSTTNGDLEFWPLVFVAHHQTKFVGLTGFEVLNFVSYRHA